MLVTRNGKLAFVVIQSALMSIVALVVAETAFIVYHDELVNLGRASFASRFLNAVDLIILMHVLVPLAAMYGIAKGRTWGRYAATLFSGYVLLAMGRSLYWKLLLHAHDWNFLTNNDYLALSINYLSLFTFLNTSAAFILLIFSKRVRSWCKI